MFISFRIWRNKLKLFLNHLTAYIASEFSSQRTIHSSCSSRELCQLYLTTKVAFLYLVFDRHFFWLYLYFFFTSFHLSEYTYWFVISVNKGTSQCICSKKFYFPIRTLPLDSSLHNYKKKRCARNTEFNLNHREKVLTRVVKLYSPFTEASKKNFFHRSAILSKTRILQDGRENMR